MEKTKEFWLKEKSGVKWDTSHISKINKKNIKEKTSIFVCFSLCQHFRFRYYSKSIIVNKNERLK